MNEVVTYCRVRPALAINELAIATRRKEGTTTLEKGHFEPDEISVTAGGGVLPVETASADTIPAAWVVPPEVALALASQGIPGWRITVVDEAPQESVLDGIVRSEAAFLRTGRSQVPEAASLGRLPGVEARVSVFVDTVEDAVAAVAAGARDLLLRDWDAEGIGELRDALRPVGLVERGALPYGLSTDDARGSLPKELFRAWLDQVDGSGAVRPRTPWAPGKEVGAPVPPDRLSFEWSDPLWVGSPAADNLETASTSVKPILARALEGSPPGTDELATLFRARGADVEAVARTADELRRRAVGEVVTYVVNRNINYTNLCYFKCGFCAFSKGPRSLNLRGDPYLMDLPEIAHRAEEAWERGATEVCLQGGIHPDFTGEFYIEVVEAIRSAVPAIHIHAFTPLEVWQGAETLGISVRDLLLRLRDAGLGTLPGTAAEILDDGVRAFLCPDKIRTAEWAHVMVTAHELGLRSTSTIMFGHIDGPESWANHLEVLRQIQRRTGGITEFVPLPFVHMGAPIYLRGRSRPGPTWDEVVLIHAVARIAFDGLIPNIQASWVKLGLEAGARLLDAGCNDLGGTLMDEIISRSAGASHGTEVTPEDFRTVITAAGRVPAQRNTVYELAEKERA
ncbi:MAG: 5-amino-6-(D-ribitylamino)uracil--L-tyrosine 4-hydroxyphenyl transferase CofH [Acidimicrobiia bacterium]